MYYKKYSLVNIKLNLLLYSNNNFYVLDPPEIDFMCLLTHKNVLVRANACVMLYILGLYSTEILEKHWCDKIPKELKLIYGDEKNSEAQQVGVFLQLQKIFNWVSNFNFFLF